MYLFCDLHSKSDHILWIVNRHQKPYTCKSKNTYSGSWKGDYILVHWMVSSVWEERFKSNKTAPVPLHKFQTSCAEVHFRTNRTLTSPGKLLTKDSKQSHCGGDQKSVFHKHSGDLVVSGSAVYNWQIYTNLRSFPVTKLHDCSEISKRKNWVVDFINKIVAWRTAGWGCTHL